uniref:Uncharacterized protein n=1 Tax=Molossus molossus TaxID=27622 RepID=A0A7J8FZ00_MOLMO|nr:hypothetical protein HJG59_008223 [Molossus molossus]
MKGGSQTFSTAAVPRSLGEAPPTTSVCCSQAGGSQGLSGGDQEAPFYAHICLQSPLENSDGLCPTSASQTPTRPSPWQTLTWRSVTSRGTGAVLQVLGEGPGVAEGGWHAGLGDGQEGLSSQSP